MRYQRWRYLSFIADLAPGYFLVVTGRG